MTSQIAVVLCVDTKMGKGKLSGTARKAINQRRAADVVKTMADDVTFGRVTKLLGFNHIMVAIQVKAGSKEIRVRIPKLFSKKGATPITTRDVVSIYVGAGFNPEEEIKSTDQFDITAILTIKQADSLVLSGQLPRWLVHDEFVSGDVKSASDNIGWEYSYSDNKDEDEESEGEGEVTNVAPKPVRKNKVVFGDDSDSDESKKLDIEAI